MKSGGQSSYVVGIIDGTGPPGAQYNVEMQYSFCKQLGKNRIAFANYERGPTASGSGLQVAVKNTKSFIEQHSSQLSKSSDLKIFLCGYSRGAFGVMWVAELLKKEKRRVDGLFLFDPVDRYLDHDVDGIPDNVRYSRTAFRDIESPQAKQAIARYDGTIDSGFGNPMRPGFGQQNANPLAGNACGIPDEVPSTVTAVQLTLAPNNGLHHKAYFLGSHGALGGVGWAIKEDAQCQMAVANWMNKGFADAGLLGARVESKGKFQPLQTKPHADPAKAPAGSFWLNPLLQPARAPQWT